MVIRKHSANPLSIPDEQRISNLLLDYWFQLRGSERILPLEDEIDPDALASVWEDCFMVQIGDISRGSGYNYTFLGDNVRKAHGLNINDDDSPPLASITADRLHAYYHDIICTREPLIDEGEFVNARGVLVKYRQVLLPFAITGDFVETIFGGMRYRLCPYEAQSDNTSK